MIMIVKTSGSQMGSPAAAEGRGEAMGEGRGESEEQASVDEEKTRLMAANFVKNTVPWVFLITWPSNRTM